MNWRGWLINLTGFGIVEQQALLSRLAGMLQAGIPLRTAFETLGRFPGGTAEGRIVRHSLHNIGHGHPFAKGYAERGWFRERMAELLVAGEENNCLVRSLQLCRQGVGREDSVWHVILWNNLRWPLSAAICCIVAVFLYLQRDLFLQVLGESESPGQRLVFAVGGTLVEHGVILALVAAALFGLLSHQLRNATGAYREWLDRWPLFRDYRLAFVSRLVPEMVSFMDVGMASLEAVGVLLRLHRGRYRQHILLELRSAVIAGMEPMDAIARLLLEKRHRAVLMSLAAAHPGHAERSLEELGNILHADRQLRYRALGRRLSFVSMLFLLLLSYGILDVIYASPAPMAGP